MSLLVSLLTAKVLPLIVPPLIAFVRAFVVKNVPPAFIPILATVGGAVLGAAASALGVEGVPTDPAMMGAAAWEGALVSLSGVGVHQAFTRLRDYKKAQKKNG
jgi:hypothetical protein